MGAEHSLEAMQPQGPATSGLCFALLLPECTAGFIQATLGYCDSRIHFLSSSRLVY